MGCVRRALQRPRRAVAVRRVRRRAVVAALLVRSAVKHITKARELARMWSDVGVPTRVRDCRPMTAQRLRRRFLWRNASFDRPHPARRGNARGRLGVHTKALSALSAQGPPAATGGPSRVPTQKLGNVRNAPLTIPTGAWFTLTHERRRTSRYVRRGTDLQRRTPNRQQMGPERTTPSVPYPWRRVPVPSCGC